MGKTYMSTDKEGQRTTAVYWRWDWLQVWGKLTGLNYFHRRLSECEKNIIELGVFLFKDMPFTMIFSLAPENMAHRNAITFGGCSWDIKYKPPGSEAWIFTLNLSPTFIPFLFRFKVRGLGRKMLFSDPLLNFLQNCKFSSCSTIWFLGWASWK